MANGKYTDPLKIKVPYRIDLGVGKGLLYHKAYSRIGRAMRVGFHIEAIALIETLMSDRLESALEVLTRSQVKADTLGSLLNQLRPYDVISDDLHARLRAWNRSRGFVIHQMVKITNSEEISWNARLSFAREAAKEGKVLLDQVAIATKRVTRKRIIESLDHS